MRSNIAPGGTLPDYELPDHPNTGTDEIGEAFGSYLMHGFFDRAGPGGSSR
jgi:hypothetical protein